MENILQNIDSVTGKRKRGRPRKNQEVTPKMPEQIQKIIDVVNETKAKEAEEFHQIIVQEKAKRKGQWDVKSTDKIEYFDSRLSYEVIGYKPIDKTRGLDFNPSWFMEARDTFEKSNKYCQYHRGSKAYDDFWTQEYKRCRDGMESHGYRITGDHYYFLNYYRLKDLTKTIKAGSGRIESFPDFFVAQYIYFHYIELCRLLRKNAVGLKARGVGFSEIGASLVVNTYQTRRESRCVVSAHADNQLQPTLDKCWAQLNFCNDNTQGGFFKLRQKHDTDDWKRASSLKKIDGQDVESGWMSEIVGICAPKPRAIRGDRTDLLLYEESGSWEGWKKAFIQGDALVGIQGNRFGIKLGWGTGGDSGPALEGLADAYEHPDVYDVLPYKHNFTSGGEETITGFFIPSYAILNLKGYIDDRGWTDPVKAKEYYEREREKKLADPKAYVIYCAEYCFTAEEALALEGTNKFNKVLITNQLASIKLYNNGPTIEDGELQFTYKSGSERTSRNVTGVKWIPGKAGNIHIIEHPLWETKQNNTDGTTTIREPMRNLYVAGIDSIDIGQNQTSEYTTNPSKFCIVIKRRAYGMSEPEYVAYYMDRPNDERTAYENAMKLLIYYNCMCNIEATRLTMVNWAKDRGWVNYFMKRPIKTYPDVNRKRSNQIGTPATAAIISHQTDLIAAYVEDYCQHIWFSEFLDQLNRYTDENKGKFDIVAALGMVELADEELAGIVATKVEENSEDDWEDVGWFINDRGYKQFGVIPKVKKQPEAQCNWDHEYDSYNMGHSSDPRYNHDYRRN